MRFVCDNCRAQYMISDDKIGAKGVKIRCKKCGKQIVVRPAGAAAPKDEGAPAAESTAAAASNGAPSSNAAGALASLGTPPEGGLFNDMEEDEIGAVFDQVLSTGSQKIPAGEPAKEAKPTTPDAVRKLADAEDEPDEPKAAAPANDWYVAIDEKQVGPLTVEKMKEHWERGEVGPDSLCWRQGFGDWIPLSEVTELASVLSPRPAKPVIVAPSPVSSSVPTVSAPVESAFAAPKNTRPEIPAAPALGVEPTSSGWKPSAASVLASLVKEENEALSKPPPKPAAEEKPAVPGLLDLPPPEPALASAARAVPMMAAAAEPMRAPQPAPMPYAPAPAYAQPAPAYAQPQPAYAGYPQPAYPGYPPPTAPAQGGGNKTVMFAGIGVGAVALLGIIAYLVFGRSPPPPPEPVTVAAVNPQPTRPPEPAPAPPAEVKPQPVAMANPGTTPTPAPGTTPTPAPGTTPAPGATTPPAVAQTTPTPPPATTPPPSPPETVAKTGTGSRTERTGSGSRGSSTPRESRSESVGSVSPPPKQTGKSDDGLDDDFDDLFKKPGDKSEKKPGNATKSPSTYIPPEPGGGDIPEKLGTADIMGVVVANKPAILKCVSEQKKRDPDITGTIVMHWMIQTSGKPTGVTVKTDEFKKTYMATCISGLIKGWSFPKHKKQGDPIDFPFKF